MVKHANVHAVIRSVFHLKDMEDNLPRISSMRYKRGLFPVLCERLGFTEGAEIGVRKGKLSRAFCRANPDLHMLCVDPWMPYNASNVDFYNRYTQGKQDRIYEACKKVLEPFNATMIRKPSLEAVHDFPDASLDFVYIDGNHTFDHVMRDIIEWSYKVKDGGLIMCHDYHPGTWAGVREAIDAYTRAHHIDPWYVTKEAQPTAYWVNTIHAETGSVR